MLTGNSPSNRTKACREAAPFCDHMVPFFVCYEETAPSRCLLFLPATAQLLPRATAVDDGAPRTQSGTTLGRPWAQKKGCAQAASLRMSSWHSNLVKTSPNLHGREKGVDANLYQHMDPHSNQAQRDSAQSDDHVERPPCAPPSALGASKGETQPDSSAKLAT